MRNTPFINNTITVYEGKRKSVLHTFFAIAITTSVNSCMRKAPLAVQVVATINYFIYKQPQPNTP